jgi:hypothetical protein
MIKPNLQVEIPLKDLFKKIMVNGKMMNHIEYHKMNNNYE